MKKTQKTSLFFCFISAFLLSTVVKAHDMKFSLLDDKPPLQSPGLLDWPWSDDTNKRKDPSAFQMDRLFELEDKLNEGVLGQTFAANEVTNTLINYQAGINDPNRPIGVFLFAGPTGVGKTQLAKELAKVLLDSEQQIIRLDMAEYNAKYSTSKLIGTTAGYIGYDEGGILTEALRGKTNAIILLDEIEKADPEVLKLFLAGFDEGRITSGNGETFNLNNCIFILTTNIASEDILNLSNAGLDNEAILKRLEGKISAHLTPELYNRITPIIFKAIPYTLYPKIIDRELFLLSKRVYSKKQLRLSFSPSVNDYLFNSIQSNRLGVRPLKRLIERHITNNVARYIVENTPGPDTQLFIAVEGEQVVIRDVPG